MTLFTFTSHLIFSSLQAQLEERQAVEAKLQSEVGEPMQGEVQGNIPKTPSGPASGDDVEDGEDEHDETETQAPVADVNAAVKALKTAKEQTIGKKIQKSRRQEAKRATKIQKKSAKASGHAGTTGADDPDNRKAVQDLEESLFFTTNITALRQNASSGVKEQRVKHALDDFLKRLEFARTNLAIEISDDEAMRSKQFLVGLFLELAWTSSVGVNGKIYKTYSQFREETQRVFYMAHQRLQVGEKQYDPLQLAKDLMSTIQAPVFCPLLGKFSFDNLETTSGEHKLNLFTCSVFFFFIHSILHPGEKAAAVISSVLSIIS